MKRIANQIPQPLDYHVNVNTCWILAHSIFVYVLRKFIDFFADQRISLLTERKGGTHGDMVNTLVRRATDPPRVGWFSLRYGLQDAECVMKHSRRRRSGCVCVCVCLR